MTYANTEKARLIKDYDKRKLTAYTKFRNLEVGDLLTSKVPSKSEYEYVIVTGIFVGHTRSDKINKHHDKNCECKDCYADFLKSHIVLTGNCSSYQKGCTQHMIYASSLLYYTNLTRVM